MNFKKSLGVLLFFACFGISNKVLKAQTPLNDFIKAHHYKPFLLPRSNWGVGTIVTYKKGMEEIVDMSCLKLQQDTTVSVLEDLSYDIKKKNWLNLGFSKLFGNQANIGLAFTTGRVKAVRITAKNAQEITIPTHLIKQKLLELAAQNDEGCTGMLTNKNYYVIVRTLSVDSLSYSFFG